MNIVLNDAKAGKAYSKKTEQPVFVGKKLGETVELDAVGLAGYKAVITGGSDKDGFPMKPSLEGEVRRKLLMFRGIGLKNKSHGDRIRKRVRGNTIGKDIHQVNMKISEYGKDKLEALFAKKEEGKEEQPEESAKDKTKKQGLLDEELKKETARKAEEKAKEEAEKAAEKKAEEKKKETKE